jgi:hypothetical protein
MIALDNNYSFFLVCILDMVYEFFYDFVCVQHLRRISRERVRIFFKILKGP